MTSSLVGVLTFLSSAVLFSLSTVFVKIISSAPYELNPLMPTMVRFFLGLLVFGTWVIVHKVDVRPKNLGLVLWRGILNSLAVLLFYGSLHFTTVTNANLLNLTYPAWMFIAGPLVTGERSPWYYGLYLILSLVGFFLISGLHSLDLNNAQFNVGDLIALVSGIIAAFGIAVLRQSRKSDTTLTIVFWLFAVGFVICLVPTILVWKTPADLWAWTCLLAAGGCGILGQVMITSGYRLLSAGQGSLISSSGILIGAAMGIVFFGDSLTWFLVVGALLVLISLLGVSGAIIKR